jgi:hypothetical protein
VLSLMLSLTNNQRSFLALDQIVVPALFNFAFNAAIGWLEFHNHTPLPLWGDPSMGLDILGMLFFLPAFSCLIGTPLIRRAAREGKVDWLPYAVSEHALLRRLPQSTWRRAAALGAVCTGVLGPPSVGALILFDATAWQLWDAIVFKGIYAGVLAAVVSPWLALYALLDERELPRPPMRQH